GPRAPHLEGGMERRHHAPLVRTDRVARTAGGAHAAPAHQPRSVPWSVAPHSRWRARAVAYGRDTLAPVGPHAAVACASGTPPLRSSAGPFEGGLEASGAAHRDPVVTLGGHQSEPLSAPPPVTSRDPATTVSVEAPPPPASRKWSWPELMRHTFGVDVLACPRCGGRMRVVATIDTPERQPSKSPSG